MVPILLAAFNVFCFSHLVISNYFVVREFSSAMLHMSDAVEEEDAQQVIQAIKITETSGYQWLPPRVHHSLVYHIILQWW